MDNWTHREPLDQLRPYVCDTGWWGFTDFAKRGGEDLTQPQDQNEDNDSEDEEDEEENMDTEEGTEGGRSASEREQDEEEDDDSGSFVSGLMVRTQSRKESRGGTPPFGRGAHNQRARIYRPGEGRQRAN